MFLSFRFLSLLWHVRHFAVFPIGFGGVAFFFDCRVKYM